MNGGRAIAIETSGRRGQAALAVGDRLLAEVEFGQGMRHGSEMMPRLEELLRGQGWAPRQVEYVYVSSGPGSFTGTRLGVTFAKTFALATGARLAVVPSPAVLVENAPGGARDAAVVVDGRRGKVWAEMFRREPGGGGLWRSLERPGLIEPAALLERLPGGCVVIGEAVRFHREAFEPAFAGEGGPVWAGEAAEQPRVASLVRLASGLAARGSFTDPIDLLPTYVRRSEAEEKRLGLE